MAHESSTEAAAGLTALQKVALSVFSVALVGSLAARALLDGPRPAHN